jgi:ribulose-phosphate 3-epimerase
MAHMAAPLIAPSILSADFAKLGEEVRAIDEAGAGSIQRIKGLGKKAGVSLNPATPAKMLDYVLEDVDLVLVMSVNPGFGGQKFITSQLKKIEAIANRIAKENLQVLVEVDGGVDAETAPQAVAAGANVLVAGTAAFRGGPDHYAANIRALKGGG